MSLWVCVILCVSHTTSLPITCQLNGNLVKRSHELLRSMGGPFPRKCIKDNVMVPFPAVAFRSDGTDAQKVLTMLINETFSSITSLFGDRDLPAEWEPKALEDFQSEVYRLSDDLGHCAERLQGLRDEAKSHFLERAKLVETYFDKLDTTLQEKNYSFCAWEIVRKELERTLRFIVEHNADFLWP
uniref:Interferon c n=1 Tax=Scleropages formosus TaxID=113540 RepID=A0A8F8SXD6_SCLFO|nr:interferon c [Scleropages formosus]